VIERLRQILRRFRPPPDQRAEASSRRADLAISHATELEGKRKQVLDALVESYRRNR